VGDNMAKIILTRSQEGRKRRGRPELKWTQTSGKEMTQ